jgi:hypothetical protein
MLAMPKSFNAPSMVQDMPSWTSALAKPVNVERSMPLRPTWRSGGTTVAFRNAAS